MQELMKSMRATTLTAVGWTAATPAAPAWAPKCWTRSTRASSAGCRADCPKPSRATWSGRWAWPRGRSRARARPTTRRRRWRRSRADAHPAGRRRRLRAAARRGGARRRGGHRHSGRIHGRAGGARDRLGAQGDPARRRHAGLQPVRHQGRRRLEGAGGRGHDDRVRRRQGAEDGGEVPRLRQLRRVFRRLRAPDARQPALSRRRGRGSGWPRRTGAQAAAGFAQGLQRAGYATDPAYAEKLGRVINTTLRLQRSIGQGQP